MCGITGFIDFKFSSSVEILDRMVQSLIHRGPDNQDSYYQDNENFALGLGHTRLAILDTSASGNQPMHFQHWSIVLNGEIYNFKEIRDSLIKLGHHFQSNSDTEVVLKSFAEWGKDCVNHFIGMFAFVIFDHKKLELYLCRDRAGVKPLYYYFKDDILIFGSELKALMVHSAFQKVVNQDAVHLFFQYGYIPGPMSIFKHTNKMEPGTWMTFSIDTRSIVSTVYWDVLDYYTLPVNPIKYEDAVEEVHNLLRSACNYRMVSDVPVGIFLSGGYDSSMVTAILQKDADVPLKTFTIGFPDGKDEAPHAKRIADFLGTEHTSYDCTRDDAIEIIPTLPYYYDEPCADISAIPTILVSKLARKKVTVTLSADGGDEIFAGYNGYLSIPQRMEKIKQIPFQSTIAGVLKGIAKVPFLMEDTIHKLQGVSHVLEEPFHNQMARLIDRSSIVPEDIIKDIFSTDILALNPIFQLDFSGLKDARSTLFVTDVKGALRDLLLVKVDRATMSVSLEGREPLLDHRLIEYVASLPFEYKHDGHRSKRILRDIADQYIPKELLDRPKTGFDLPVYQWLKKDLSYLLDELIEDNDFYLKSKINTKAVMRLVKKFRNDQLKYIDILWRILMYRMWWNYWINEKPHNI